MPISVDVLLVSTVLQRPDVSAMVELSGGLGSTRANGTVTASAEPSGTLSGGRIALSGSVSVATGGSGTGTRVFLFTEDGQYPYGVATYGAYLWNVEVDSYNLYYTNLTHSTELTSEDIYGVTPDVMELRPEFSMTVALSAAPVLPSFPAAAPEPAEPGGEFPMPAAGGMIVRAVAGIAVQVDTPVIVDGRPT